MWQSCGLYFKPKQITIVYIYDMLFICFHYTYRSLPYRNNNNNNIKKIIGTLQITIRKNKKIPMALGTCDVILCGSYTSQSALECGEEACIVQIHFSAAFDNFEPHGILFKLCSLGIDGSVLPVRIQFLPNRTLYFVVDGCRAVFLARCCSTQLYTLELFSILEN